jgi:hypothetical protein
MIPFIQSKVVVKNSNGDQVVNGNCYPTAIACILGIPPTDVPNIETLWDVGVSFAYEVMFKWLHEKGYKLRDVAMEYSVFHDGSEKIKNTNNEYYLSKLSVEQKDGLRAELKDRFYLVSGKSPRGIYHVCVYQNGIMVHDPHPTGEGIVTEEIFEVIEKLS